MFLPFSLSSAAWLSTIYIISLCASKVNSISKLYTFAIALLPLMKEHFIFRAVISGRGDHLSGGGVPPLPLPRSLSGRFSAFRLALTIFVIGFCFSQYYIPYTVLLRSQRKTECSTWNIPLISQRCALHFRKSPRVLRRAVCCFLHDNQVLRFVFQFV